MGFVFLDCFPADLTWVCELLDKLLSLVQQRFGLGHLLVILLGTCIFDFSNLFFELGLEYELFLVTFKFELLYL